MTAEPLIRSPTPYAEVNAVLQQLMEGVYATLGSQVAGVYLYGSLTSGDFDRQSDIDVLVVTREEISENVVAVLAAMHEKIATGESWCATQLEVAYIPLLALPRYDAATSVYPHLDRGKGERLQMKEHWRDCVVQRHALRERGITIVGPHPATLIEPVSPGDLRQAMRDIIPRWTESLFADPGDLARRGTQAYVVLSICRMLYTLETGSVASKRQAADWVKAALDEKWNVLVDRAWSGREDPHAESAAEEVSATLDFMRYAVNAAAVPPPDTPQR